MINWQSFPNHWHHWQHHHHHHDKKNTREIVQKFQNQRPPKVNHVSWILKKCSTETQNLILITKLIRKPSKCLENRVWNSAMNKWPWSTSSPDRDGVQGVLGKLMINYQSWVPAKDQPAGRPPTGLGHSAVFLKYCNKFIFQSFLKIRKSEIFPIWPLQLSN